MYELRITGSDKSILPGDSFDVVALGPVIIAHLVPPNDYVPNGFILAETEAGNFVDLPVSRLGAVWHPVPYRGPRGDPAVTFNTAAHQWAFPVGSTFTLKGEDTALRGKVMRRLYDGDNGSPYYYVRWMRQRRIVCYGMEHAEQMQRDYRIV